MTIVIRKDTNLNEVKAKIQKMAANQGFDAKKFAGTVRVTVDPLLYQKQVRDEWD
ncbi:MAG: hypothetical protein AB8F95_18475 [Bacteroidia bacterium]